MKTVTDNMKKSQEQRLKAHNDLRLLADLRLEFDMARYLEDKDQVRVLRRKLLEARKKCKEATARVSTEASASNEARADPFYSDSDDDDDDESVRNVDATVDGMVGV